MPSRPKAKFSVGDSVTPRCDNFFKGLYSEAVMERDGEVTHEVKQSRIMIPEGSVGVVMSGVQAHVVAHQKMSGWPTGVEFVVYVMFPQGSGWFEPSSLKMVK